jgi:hypothetical protein
MDKPADWISDLQKVAASVIIPVDLGPQTYNSPAAKLDRIQKYLKAIKYFEK